MQKEFERLVSQTFIAVFALKSMVFFLNLGARGSAVEAYAIHLGGGGQNLDDCTYTVNKFIMWDRTHDLSDGRHQPYHQANCFDGLYNFFLCK